MLMHKVCSRCHLPKPLSEFYKRKASADGLMAACKGCIAIYEQRDDVKERRQLWDRERSKTEKRVKYRSTPHVKAQTYAYQKVWRKQNKTRLNEKKRIEKQIRRARKSETVCDWTIADERYAFNYWQNCCAVCGRPRGLWHTLALDHWIAQSKGGDTIPCNMIPLCHGVHGCNESKHNHDPLEWLTRKLGSRRAREKQVEITIFFSTVRQCNAKRRPM